MGSATSKIAATKALAHFAAGPIALVIAFIGNLFVNLIIGKPALTITPVAILLGGVALFIVNMLIAAFYTVPSALKERCNKEISVDKRLLYGLWPAFFSVIGDPNIVTMITFATPLIIFAPVIMAMLPPGPLTIGSLMLAQNFLSGIPIIGTIINIFPLTKLFNFITGSWIFLIAMFLIGYNIWSWVGGAVAATHAINNTC